MKLYYGGKYKTHRILGIQFGTLFIGIMKQYAKIDGWIHIKRESKVFDGGEGG